MAAFSGCHGTVFHLETPEEVLGVSLWSMDRVAKSKEYADNTTGCNTSVITGGITSKFKVNVNLQDGSGKGTPPWDAGDTVVAQFHIDDTEENYFGCDAKVLSMNNYKVDIESGDPVSVDYEMQAMGAVTGFGTLAAFGS